jgi:two-component system, NtrC family, sensor kinase
LIGRWLASVGFVSIYYQLAVSHAHAFFWFESDTEYMNTLKHNDSEITHYREELQAKDLELIRASEDLSRTKDMLLQQEKLASIGQLAAGVAHEINNPIAFVQSNLRTLENYLSSIRTLLERVFEMKKLQGMDEVRRAWDEIDRIAEEADLEFILEDTKVLVPQSLEGVERVRQIVADLKSFSRDDESKREIVDVHECINGALNIVWNELKYHVALNKSFGSIPAIDCYPRQLTQVFVNLLINAGQAIQDQGEIRISTMQEGNFVVVTIADNGSGIPEPLQARVFDPFFTTKEVGKGTGLGLSIAYGIIQKHRGSIRLKSEAGKGTEFRIELPIDLAEPQSV